MNSQRTNLSPKLKIKKIVINESRQFLVFSCLSAIFLGFIAILSFFNASLFIRFLGTMNPLLVGALVVFLGFVTLLVLVGQGWFSIYLKNNSKGLIQAAGLALLFGAIIVPVDMIIHFPKNMNEPLPEALLFYPVMGFLVEVVFKLLPLTLLLVIFSLVFRKINIKEFIWPCLFFVSALEGIYHALNTIFYGDLYPVWFALFVGIHVTLINFAQLSIFKRYDFVAMFTLRLVYYSIWHLTWGYFRLSVIF